MTQEEGQQLLTLLAQTDTLTRRLPVTSHPRNRRPPVLNQRLSLMVIYSISENVHEWFSLYGVWSTQYQGLHR